MQKYFRKDEYYEELLKAGISAVKAGHLLEGRRILEKAARIKTTDARLYIWLSGATEDKAERRVYLEKAVAAEPGNASARRALLLLNEKFDKDRLIPEEEQVKPRRPTLPEDAHSQVYPCPHCGARLAYQVESGGLGCAHCGFIQMVDRVPAADRAEQTLDFVLATTRAHRWAEAQQRVVCSQCGALSLLPPGQTADRCAYCASNRVVASAESVELIDPQAIVPFFIAEKQASRLVSAWWTQGLTSPDDLAGRASILEIHPVYLPFWTFDGAAEFPYTCQVNLKSVGSDHWVSRTGVVYELFDDILVPGAKSLPPETLASIEPFHLKEVVAFQPEFLAGWPAVSYDRTLADASLLARQKVTSTVRCSLPDRIETGSQKRHIRLGGGQWSAMTYKYIMLPVWVGSYSYRGRRYSLLVNGQTGKVGGEKPHDRTKIILLTAIALGLLAALAISLSYLWPLLSQ